MGGPVDTRVSPTAVNVVGASQSLDWFERKVIDLVPPHYPGAMRRVYPGFLQLGGFMSMNPDRHVQSHIDFFQHLVVGDGESAAGHRRFYDEYLSVMDLSADFYLDTIRHVFQEHSLPVGAFTHRGEKVEPAAIRKTALMTIEGELDDISGVGPDQGRPRPLPQHPRRQAPPPRTGRRRPLRHLQRPQMAPVHLSGLGGVRAQGQLAASSLYRHGPPTNVGIRRRPWHDHPRVPLGKTDAAVGKLVNPRAKHEDDGVC